MTIEDPAYTQEQLDLIKEKIKYRLDQAVAMGFNFIRADTGVKKANPNATFFPKPNPTLRWIAETPNVDVGGAIAIVTQIDGATVEEVVCIDWKVNTIFVGGFVHGYDMSNPEWNSNLHETHSPRYVQGYLMGAEIAKQYLKDHSNEETV